MERWTIITEEGLLLLRDDIFTEDEAKAYVANHPATPDGTPVYAVTQFEAQRAQVIFSMVGARMEERKRIERIESVREMLNSSKGKR